MRTVTTRWLQGDAARGADYDARFQRLAASGIDVHGEADLVWSLVSGATASVLDAGCGTGRVGIELARRGLSVVGVDIDQAMLAQARAKAPRLRWIHADLADPRLDAGGPFDVVVAAGNVMIFLEPGTEAAVVANLARHLCTDGRLVAGFALERDGLSLERYDGACAAAGLALADRWATWDRQPWTPEANYAVSVHRRTETVHRAAVVIPPTNVRRPTALRPPTPTPGRGTR